VIIEHYGIRLKRLTLDKIELVRAWRNDPKIQQHMFFANPISETMQAKWFSAINTIFNHYFLIEFNKKEVGLIHASDIDYQAKTASAGLFIYEDKYWGTDVPVRASLAMLDFFFQHHLIDSFFAKTKTENKPALNYNKQLGFVQKEMIEEGQGVLLELTKQNYYERTSAFRKVAGSESMKLDFDRKNEVEMLFFETHFQHTL